MALQLEELTRVSRKLRNPSHTWQVRHKPFTIQPMCIAPVLPGETMKNATFQARVVTDPIKNPLIGWWIEYYWFYVKHRDLQQQLLLDMMLDPGTDLSSLAHGSADLKTYHPGTAINWTKRCMEKVVEHYFRDSDEAWDLHTIDGMPSAMINSNSWMDSLQLNADVVDGDFDIDLNADDTITAGEASRALMLWEHLRANNMTDMSYEDYLRSYGVRVSPQETMNVPELIRYVRDWSYPANTIDPETGEPSSAVSWAVSERIDKDRFFKEPGFICGYTVARPKVYLSRQVGVGVHLLQDAYSWLPAIMRDQTETSLKQIVDTTGSLLEGTTTDGCWVDVRDLFVYGDQFLNFALTETDAGLVALPVANLSNIRYPTEAMADGLFVADTKEVVRQDGVIRFSILGTQTDQTPRGNTLGFRM